jgi:DNA-binding NarL/FixJ family response regulator
VLEGAADESIAVTIRPATPDDLLDLICASYGLTAREQHLLTALLAGHDTTGLAADLVISRHTVQGHFKSMFAKTGVHSRREPIALARSGTAA